MPECPNVARCELHQRIGMQAALRVWRSFYCEGMFTRCERYKLAQAGVDIPDRLLPNGRLQGERDAPDVHGPDRAAS